MLGSQGGFLYDPEDFPPLGIVPKKPCKPRGIRNPNYAPRNARKPAQVLQLNEPNKRGGLFDDEEFSEEPTENEGGGKTRCFAIAALQCLESNPPIYEAVTRVNRGWLSRTLRKMLMVARNAYRKS